MKPWKSPELPCRHPAMYRFNGATAMKPWKRVESLSKVMRTIELQWGHGDEAGEEHRERVSAVEASVASMGPRR